MTADSSAPRPRVELNVDGIAESLKKIPQWVGFKFTPPKKPGDKPGKVPVNPLTGRNASTTDGKTWDTFHEAVAAYKRGTVDGIGFVFTDSGRSGVDFDHCRDPETGVIDPAVLAQVHELASYTEVSPTGTGIHVIAGGNLPGKGIKVGNTEMYDSGRFFTVTGERVPDTPAEVADRPVEIAALYEQVKASRTASKTNQSPPRPPPNEVQPASGHSDDDVALQFALTNPNNVKFKTLWAGDISGYVSQSEADLALCSLLHRHCKGGPERVDRLFRRSGLMRPKWDEKHGENTYGQNTVEKVCSGPPPPQRDDKPPKSNTSAANNEQWFKLTDTGNAERLVHHCGGDLRYCHLWKKWLAWRETHWSIDDDGTPMLISKRVVRGIYDEAARCDDAPMRELIGEWAHKCEKVDRRKALVELAKSEKGIPIRSGNLDRHEFLLNCLNWTLDLKTFVMRPHRREDYLTKLCPTRFDPNAKCPTWLAFLERVLPDDEVRDFVQRFIGYSLTSDVSEQVLLLLLGDGANGKSTFVRAIQDVLSTDYAIQISSDLLIAKEQRGHPTEIADLFGVRLAFGIETAKGQALDEALIKQLTGGDRIKARRMREDFWEFSPTHKIALITNHMPQVVGTDHAIWRRLLLIKFNVTIPRAERDPKLQRKLLDEREGILAWAVRGCQAWTKHGLQIPESVIMNPPNSGSKLTIVEQFIDIYVRRIVGVRTRAAELYSRFTTFCETNGVTRASQQEFGTTLGRKGFGGKKSEGVMVYIDTALIDPDGDHQGGEGQPSALNALDPLTKESMRTVVPLVPSPPQSTAESKATSSQAGNDRPAQRRCHLCNGTRFWRLRGGTYEVCGTCTEPMYAPEDVEWLDDPTAKTAGTPREVRKSEIGPPNDRQSGSSRSPRSSADDVRSTLECEHGPEVA